MIYLYDHLATDIGETVDIKANSIGRAIQLIEANFRGFLKKINQEGGYQVFRNGTDTEALTKEEVLENIKYKNAQDWHIMPYIKGAGKAGAVVLGVVLVVVGAVMSVYGYGAGVPLMKLGGAIALGGVAAMFAPAPKTHHGANIEAKEDRGSFLVNGSFNRTEAGGARTLLCGRWHLGTTVVNANAEVEDQSE